MKRVLVCVLFATSLSACGGLGGDPAGDAMSAAVVAAAGCSSTAATTLLVIRSADCRQKLLSLADRFIQDGFLPPEFDGGSFDTRATMSPLANYFRPQLAAGVAPVFIRAPTLPVKGASEVTAGGTGGDLTTLSVQGTAQGKVLPPESAITISKKVIITPEPETFWLLGAGLIAVALVRRRKRRKADQAAGPY